MLDFARAPAQEVQGRVGGRVGRRLALRVFATAWLVFALHFATDIVREHYLSFSLAEDYAFRMDKYLGLHVDIFDTPGRGAHIGNNPGVSMLGAIPYLVTRPVIDFVVERTNARRAESSEPLTAVYDDPRPRRVEFYRKVREMGLDIRFGLAAGVIHSMYTAPMSALGVVIMLQLLAALGFSRRQALVYALLFGFGTPVLFRTGFINQNLLIAFLVLFGFIAIWRPHGYPAWSARTGWMAAGLFAGFSLLSDYSGLVVVAWLAAYAAWTAFGRGGMSEAARATAFFGAGAVPPIALLLFYQWRSFGSPWYPGQHYMPPVEWIEVGYQGVGLPQLDLFAMLLFDGRFGLFVTCPLLILGVVGFVRAWRGASVVPRQEAVFLFGFTVALVVFFSAVQYTRLQYVTGIRYIVPVIPALFLLAVPVLASMRPWVRYAVIVLAVTEAWCLAMARATWVHESIARVLFGGFQLPWLNVLSRMSTQYFPFMEEGTSPLPVFVLAGAVLYGIWRYPQREVLD